MNNINQKYNIYKNIYNHNKITQNKDKNLNIIKIFQVKKSFYRQ